MSEVLSEVLVQKDYNKVSAIVSFMEEHGEITPKREYNLVQSLLVSRQIFVLFIPYLSNGKVSFRIANRLITSQHLHM